MRYTTGYKRGILGYSITHLLFFALGALAVTALLYRRGAGFAALASTFVASFAAMLFGTRAVAFRIIMIGRSIAGDLKNREYETSEHGIIVRATDGETVIPWASVVKIYFAHTDPTGSPIDYYGGKMFGNYVVESAHGVEISIPPTVQQRDSLLREIISRVGLKKQLARGFIDDKPDIAEWVRSKEPVTDADLNVSVRRVSELWQYALAGVIVIAAFLVFYVAAAHFAGMDYFWK